MISTLHVAPRIGLVGVHGHGRWHLDTIVRLADSGAAQLAAVCDSSAIDESAADLVAARGGRTYSSYDDMLAGEQLDVVVIVTPPHVHRAMAIAAMEQGADVLLEKPPTVRAADLEEVIATAERTGRLCQVGFQSLAAGGIDAVRERVLDGSLGDVTRVSAAGAWVRRPSYFSRGRWTGRRFVDGVAAGDGAVSNPFAHALMNCLSIAASERPSRVAEIEAELFRANDIEADDTSSLRLTLANGRIVTMAVTLCADEVVEPYVLVHGSEADLWWSYTLGDLELRPHGLPARAVDTGTGVSLLENLISVRAGDEAQLRCPPQACREFTRVTETLLDQMPVRAIPTAYVTREEGDQDAPAIVPGVSALVQDTAAAGLLFSETGTAWA